VIPWFFLTGLMIFEPKLVSVFGRDWRTVSSSCGVYVLWVCSPAEEKLSVTDLMLAKLKLVANIGAIMRVGY
jgi:hypothetical protein